MKINFYYYLIAFPIISGIVGYVTNALAIRMLFRPFKPHWYTLGWQGLIPRSRTMLAKNVAKVVGERLVTAEEINKTLNSPGVRGALATAVYNTLTGYDTIEARNEVSDNLKSYFDKIAVNIAESLLASKELRRSVDMFATRIARKSLSVALNLKARTMMGWVKNISDSDSAKAVADKLRSFVEKKARNSIHSFIFSGKSINDLIPGMIDTRKLAQDLTLQLMPMLTELFSRRDIADRVGSVLIEYKNDQFAGMKLSAINMFIGDEKIKTLAREKVPEIGRKIVHDSSVQASITQIIEDKLEELAHKPLSSLADSFGDRYYTILHYVASGIASKTVPQDLFAVLDGTNISREVTIGDILGVKAEDIIPQQLRLSMLLISSDAGRYVRNMISGNISNIALTPNQLTVFSSAASDWVVHILKSLVPHMLRLININMLVEEKINSLELEDVEDMLFSFMRSHFKWINILGFVIGFIVGLGQILLILVTNI